MKRLLILATFCLAGTAPALADGKIYVQLPDLSAYRGDAAEALLTDLVLANVVSSNCTGFGVTDAEWSLLVDSADMIAYGQLGLSVEDYDDLYYDPAFEALDRSDTCAAQGPRVEPLLQQLVDLGGGREALPDQDQAYADYQATQAQWEARQGQGPRSGKTK